VTRFQELVNDLIELARSDQPADRAPTDVADIARQVCHSRGLNDSILHGPDGGDCTWMVDGRRLEQVLVNLVDNAIAYGGGPTAVRLAREPGRYVIEVEDQGPGVSPQDRPIIFHRFIRGRSANARGNTDGTGLGLALVAQHAAAHGGTATVLDRPGGGARFRVELREPTP
jgi:signal transduction histidine kinase